ncbi:MAG: c-type cytochrome domain-containing protein, partial [Planctomycetota bacterium]|nr:c-type cytochrome domain-containing protein [Planctomycetota bacterium]
AEGDAQALEREAKKLEQLRQVVSSMKLAVLAKAAPNAKPVVAAKKPAPKPKPMAAKKPAPKPTPAAAKKPAPKPTPAAAKKPAPKPKPAAMASAEHLAAGAADQTLLTYDDHVYPIFDEHCIACHDQGDASGGLDLGAYSATVQGGSSGKTLRPGNPDESRLYLLVSHKEKPTMPPKEPRIDVALIDTIRDWIAQGAPKDRAQAEQLAVRRAKARAKAEAEAAAREAEKVVVQAVMPEQLQSSEKRFPARPGAMRAVAASPGAPLLAAPGFGQVLLLHQHSFQELGVLEFPFGQVEALSFSADASAFVAAGGTPGKQGGAVVYDVRTGDIRGRFGERKDAALTAALAPRGDLVAVGGTRRRVRVFRVSDGAALWQHAHDDWVTAMAFSPDGKMLATGDRQGGVVIREADNGREVHDFKGADGVVTSLAFSPDAASLATAGADRSVSLFRMRDGRRMFRKASHTDQALCVTWRSPSSLISAGADGRVLTWKTSGSRDADLPRVADWVYGVAASADGAQVFTADWRGRLIAYDVKTRKVIRTITPLAVTP